MKIEAKPEKNFNDNQIKSSLGFDSLDWAN
jgi:hypothetical protein